MADIRDSDAPNAGEDAREPSTHTAGGRGNGRATLENSWETSSETKHATQKLQSRALIPGMRYRRMFTRTPVHECL